MRYQIAGLAAAAALAFTVSPAFAQSADDAVGTWRDPGNDSLIRLYKCGSNLCGSIAKVTDGQKYDNKNPNPAKRKRSIVGLNIIHAKRAGLNTWSGSLYNRKDGNTYSGSVTVNSKNSLSLSGCSLGIFCKTTTWSRVD